MGIRRLTLTRAIRVARGNDVACREAGDTKSTLISASWPSYTLSSMVQPKNRNIKKGHSKRRLCFSCPRVFRTRGNPTLHAIRAGKCQRSSFNTKALEKPLSAT